MIELTVQDKKICFNLSTIEREQGLFNTWYAMSDMPTYLSKKINITTDKNEHLSYTIGEISNCIYSPEVWTYTENKVEEVLKDDKEETLSDIYDNFFPDNNIFSESLKNAFLRTFSILPVCKIKKMFQFTKEVLSLGLPLFRDNPVMIKLISDIVHDSDGDISEYIKLYQDSLGSNGSL